MLIFRLSTSFAYYGLSMDLQKFGVDIYLIQVIFGAVDIPAKVVVTICMSFIGRRPSQCGALIVAGVTILVNVLVPYGMSESLHASEVWVWHMQCVSDSILQKWASVLMVFHFCADKQTVRTCLAVVGKGCLAASFNCCYLYSGELFPTIIR